MHLSARDLVLDCICNVKYETFFTIARPFFDTKNSFNDFFGYLCAFKMKLNNFLFGSILSGIDLVKEY